MATKPITNQRTKKDIREEVLQIDKEVPDGQTFVDIMENKEPVAEEPAVTPDITLEEPEQEPEPITEEESTAEEHDDDEPDKAPLPRRELPPIEERYREAGQEAMILNSKNKKILETIEEAENLGDPTIEELRVFSKEMGSDYDDLDAFAQNILKESLLSKQRFGKISSLVAEEKQVAKWVEKVEDFLSDEKVTQKYPALSGMTDDFVRYASKKSHIGADLELLVAGFMWKTPSKKQSGSVLLPSSKGGSSAKPKANEGLTEMDAKTIRTTDPKKYKQMIKGRKFKTSL